MIEVLRKAIAEHKDPHVEVAKAMFNTDNPTKAQRKLAKQQNFFLIYSHKVAI